MLYPVTGWSRSDRQSQKPHHNMQMMKHFILFSVTFLKNLHWFYLSRFLRVTPLLAVTVLLQASYFNRITDGPHWRTVINHTERCRRNWWSTLLHIQNLVHVDQMVGYFYAIVFFWYMSSNIDERVHQMLGKTQLRGEHAKTIKYVGKVIFIFLRTPQSVELHSIIKKNYYTGYSFCRPL